MRVGVRYDVAMRILLVALVLGLGVVGCGDDTTTSSVDMSADMTMVVHDMAGVDMATALVW